MSLSPGKVILKDGHRLYDRLNTILIIHAAIGVASLVRLGEDVHFSSGDKTLVECQHAAVHIRVPVYGPLENSLGGLALTPIEIEFIHKDTWSEIALNARPSSGGLRLVLTQAISPVFVEFFESIHQWLRDKGKEETWPPTLRFARVVRHAISHGFKISYELKKGKPAPPPVRWHGLTYSVSNQGKKIFGTDIRFGDLVALMLEMSDELDVLGCPL